MKSLFLFQPDHVLDIITNSSSELFVLRGQTKDIVREMILAVYPSFLNEYHDLKSSQELNVNEVHIYLTYHLAAGEVLPGFTKDEMYDLSREDRWATRYVRHDFPSEKNLEKVLEAIDPHKKMFFMFSRGDNPDYDFQELLSSIGDRYHLG
jgi:hypothetical protein